MARPYAGAAGTHLFLGLLSMAAGIAWICLLYFYEPLFQNGESVIKQLDVWVTILLCAKIFSGVWFFITGAIGCCIKNRGCTEGVFVALNVLNVIIWAPALILIQSAVVLLVLIFSTLQNSADGSVDVLGSWENNFSDMPWLWIFPAIGLFVGVIEFCLSVASYSIVCCCRPSSLDDGYEYQYEMK